MLLPVPNTTSITVQKVQSAVGTGSARQTSSCTVTIRVLTTRNRITFKLAATIIVLQGVHIRVQSGPSVGPWQAQLRVQVSAAVRVEFHTLTVI